MKKIIKYYFLLIINTYSTIDINKEENLEQYPDSFYSDLRDYFNLLTNEKFDTKYSNDENNQISLQEKKEKPESNKEILPCNKKNANNIIRKKKHKSSNYDINDEIQENILKKYKETLVSLYNTLHNLNIQLTDLDDDGFNALKENLEYEYDCIKKKIKKNCSTENLTEKQIDFITRLSRYAHCLQKKKCRSKDEKTKIILSNFFKKFTSKFPSTRYEGEIIKFYQNTEAVFENMTVKDVIEIFQTIAKTNNLNQEQENYCKKYYEYRNLKCNSIKHFPKHQIELEFTKIEQTFRQLKLSNT